MKLWQTCQEQIRLQSSLGFKQSWVFEQQCAVDALIGVKKCKIKEIWCNIFDILCKYRQDCGQLIPNFTFQTTKPYKFKIEIISFQIPTAFAWKGCFRKKSGSHSNRSDVYLESCILAGFFFFQYSFPEIFPSSIITVNNNSTTFLKKAISSFWWTFQGLTMPRRKTLGT